MSNLLLDIGSHTIKMIFFEDIDNIDPKNYKKYEFLNYFVTLKSNLNPILLEDLFDNKLLKENIYKVKSPFTKGVLVNYKSQFKILNLIFTSLKEKGIIEQDNIKFYNIKLIYSPNYPRKSLQNTIEFFFDYIGSKSLQLIIKGEYINCLKNGILVDVSHSKIDVIPIFDYQYLNYAVRRSEIGGKLQTKFLSDKISLTQLNINSYFLNVCKIKEEILNYNDEFANETINNKFRNYKNIKYLLPDFSTEVFGKIIEDHSEITNNSDIITISKEKIILEELPFNPSIIGANSGGIIDALNESISLLPNDLKQILPKNILIVGGLSKNNNFRNKFKTEFNNNINKLYNYNYKFIDKSLDLIDIIFRNYIIKEENNINRQLYYEFKSEGISMFY